MDSDVDLFMRCASGSGFPGLTCLRCHSTNIMTTQEVLECQECGAAYPVAGRVPVMFDRVTLPRTPRYAAARTASDLLTAFHLPADPLHVLQMRRLLAQRPVFGDTMVRTEAAQFLDRVRASGNSIAEGVETTYSGTNSPPAGGPLRMRWLRDYIPRTIPSGHHFTANVRFCNTGVVPLRHAPPAHVTLAVRWFDNDGQAVDEAEDVRTSLPLDVPPGQELTLPIKIVAPPREGRHLLRLIMVEEGVGWLNEDAVDISVSLRRVAWAETPPGWTITPEMRLDYAADHVRGLEIMRAWVDALNVPFPRVLEIGGNAYPVVAEIDGELHNVDVDLLGLQIGCLVQDRMEQERPGRRVRLICANADELPYSDGYFDAIVMFATLHHFADPGRTLIHASAKLRRGGFIGLFCEPVGHVDPGSVDPAYLGELQRGVNEQSFLLREWAEIFRAAKLTVAEAVVEGSSLKAKLVHMPRIADQVQS